MPTKWSFEADYLQACNCDYGCPCEFSAPPTLGYCEGVGAWRINRGRYGDVPLDGLGLAFAARWPKALHEGNGTLCLFFDERASPAQRDALFQIASGKAGGLPFEIIAATISRCSNRASCGSSFTSMAATAAWTSAAPSSYLPRRSRTPSPASRRA